MKLHPEAVIGQYMSTGAAGFDLYATETVDIFPGETKLVKTGIAVAIPEGYELQVRPRSGTSLKTKLRVANSPGTVDSDYRGEICIIVDNIDFKGLSELPITVNKGERIAQAVINKIEIPEFEEVDSLEETERGDKAFGSTGTK